MQKMMIHYNDVPIYPIVLSENFDALGEALDDLMIKNRKQVREVVIRRLVFVIVVTIYYGSQAAQIDNAAHVGGLIGGIVLTVLFTLHWNHSRKGYVAE